MGDGEDESDYDSDISSDGEEEVEPSYETTENEPRALTASGWSVYDADHSGFKSAVKDFMTERRAEILAVPPGTTMKAHRQRFLIEAVETLFPRVATAQLAVAKRKSPKKKKKKKKKKLRAPDSADESLSKPQGKDTGRQYTAAEMRHVLARTGLFRPLERDLILSFIKPKLMSEFTGPFLAPDFDSLTSVMRAAPTLFEMLHESGSVLGAFEMKKVCHWDAEAWTCMIRDVLEPLTVLAGSVERDGAPSVSDTTQITQEIEEALVSYVKENYLLTLEQLKTPVEQAHAGSGAERKRAIVKLPPSKSKNLQIQRAISSDVGLLYYEAQCGSIKMENNAESVDAVYDAAKWHPVYQEHFAGKPGRNYTRHAPTHNQTKDLVHEHQDLVRFRLATMYSPICNAIEGCFSLLKAATKRYLALSHDDMVNVPLGQVTELRALLEQVAESCVCYMDIRLVNKMALRQCLLRSAAS
ncbi:uncharacterized protein IUM83_19491 [Phytophthora cinnamomi]|uniref:uncharacterized protein n=1 Tax=Phytophthora cinnamomi TaxID=4785 RepID=UPI003559798A|nr:hypothetical protein IUM83_19491 [Phytophthora cinnamomi]